MKALTDFFARIGARLNWGNDYLPPLLLRLILAWEFYESGITKVRGDNWFGDIPWADWQAGFPWPFSALSADLNWFLATWGELVFAAMLLLGLFTRFAAFSLIIITVVATTAVHWPAQWDGLAELWRGYVITSEGSGNFKLPLLFVIMLIPLVFGGGGKISLDHALCRVTGCEQGPGRRGGMESLALMLAILGATLMFVMPTIALLLLGLAVVALIAGRLTGAGEGNVPHSGD